MFTNIDRITNISASSVYAAPDGTPLEKPSALDADITLPTISHPTSTINMMGSYDVADRARVDNLQLTIGCQTSKEALELLKYENFIIRFAALVEKAETGQSEYVGFTVYAQGHCASSGGQSLNVGENGTQDVTVNCIKYRLLQDEDELVNIDRLAGIMKIAGVDLRESINRLL